MINFLKDIFDLDLEEWLEITWLAMLFITLCGLVLRLIKVSLN